MRATSTTRCSPSPIRTIPAAGACWSPSPTSPGTCGHDKPLDRAAYRRGTSVYFPDRVVPMLPEALSNHWCSLVPREDRPVLVAEMWIDAEGTSSATASIAP